LAAIGAAAATPAFPPLALLDGPLIGGAIVSVDYAADAEGDATLNDAANAWEGGFGKVADAEWTYLQDIASKPWEFFP